MIDPGATIAAIATPPGIGALGIVRMSGPSAREIAQGLLGTAGGPLEPRRARFGRALGETGAVDQVVATYFDGPASPTGEDVVELTAHGSPHILRRILEEALRLGARLAGPGEFTLRAVLNGRLDLAQAEAVADLVRSRTEASRRAALRQLEGGLSAAVSQARTGLWEMLVHVEALLDHPNEGVPELEPGRGLRRLEASARRLEELAATFHRGRLLSEGARICLAGRPNAGKSSLLNALLGRERAIVCAEPGTTRDLLEEAVDLGCGPAVVVDTAGLGDDGACAAERLARELSERALKGADIAVLVVDRSVPAAPEDLRAHRRVAELAGGHSRPMVLVHSKSDLPRAAAADPGAIEVCALTGAGIQALRERLARELSGAEPSDGVVVCSLRHARSLEAAGLEARAAAEAARRPAPGWEERAACHLREACARLGEILGERASPELLRDIFSRFCIGK